MCAGVAALLAAFVVRMDSRVSILRRDLTLPARRRAVMVWRGCCYFLCISPGDVAAAGVQVGFADRSTATTRALLRREAATCAASCIVIVVSRRGPRDF